MVLSVRLSSPVVYLLLSACSGEEQQRLGFEPSSLSQHYRFNPLVHLPGISPYFDAVGSGLEHCAPLGCHVTAASYLVRHGAIYANDHDYQVYIEPFLRKLHSSRHAYTGPLSFLTTWQSPITDADRQLEQITPGGAADAEKVARHLFRRYPDLVPTTKKMYADKKPRTLDTARAFVRAFPQNDIEVVNISRHREFHSIIPHKSCPAFTKKAGDEELDKLVEHYTRPTIARLQPHAPVALTANDVVGMQQLCGYESGITGKVSELCGVFTPLEWLGYEYAWDVKYNYMVGPANPLSPYLGMPWLNVTADLFRKISTPSTHFSGLDRDARDENDDGQRFFVSFTHREVPPCIATALGFFSSSVFNSSALEELPLNRINFGRAWKMAELVPFLGHLGIEKMTCNASSGFQSLSGSDFVRVVANGAPRPIPACQDGPGASCAFEEFISLVESGMKRYGDFHGVCGDIRGPR